MLSKPQLRSSLRLAIPEPEEIVFLLTERNGIELEGHLFKLLLPLLDGHLSVDRIVEQLSERVSPAEVYYALLLLEKNGYIVEADEAGWSDDRSRSIAVFCDTLNLPASKVRHRLQNVKVAVQNFSSIATAELTSTLASMQVQVANEGDLEVVLTDDYLCADLAAINRQALDRSRPWLLAKPLGSIVWLGPIFYPRVDLLKKGK